MFQILTGPHHDIGWVWEIADHYLRCPNWVLKNNRLKFKILEKSPIVLREFIEYIQFHKEQPKDHNM